MILAHAHRFALTTITMKSYLPSSFSLLKKRLSWLSTQHTLLIKAHSRISTSAKEGVLAQPGASLPATRNSRKDLMMKWDSHFCQKIKFCSSPRWISLLTSSNVTATPETKSNLANALKEYSANLLMSPFKWLRKNSWKRPLKTSVDSSSATLMWRPKKILRLVSNLKLSYIRDIPSSHFTLQTLISELKSSKKSETVTPQAKITLSFLNATD